MIKYYKGYTEYEGEEVEFGEPKYIITGGLRTKEDLEKNKHLLPKEEYDSYVELFNEINSRYKMENDKKEFK